MKTIYEGTEFGSLGMITTKIDSDDYVYRITTQVNNYKPKSLVISCVEVAIMHAHLVSSEGGSVTDFAIRRAVKRLEEYKNSEVSNG